MSFSVMTHVISVFLISIENFYIPCRKTNQRKFVDSGIVKTQTSVRPSRLASSILSQYDEAYLNKVMLGPKNYHSKKG